MGGSCTKTHLWKWSLIYSSTKAAVSFCPSMRCQWFQPASSEPHAPSHVLTINITYITFDKRLKLLPALHTVDYSEILRSPVEAGSLSHYLQGLGYIQKVVVWDFFKQNPPKAVELPDLDDRCHKLLEFEVFVKRRLDDLVLGRALESIRIRISNLTAISGEYVRDGNQKVIQASFRSVKSDLIYYCSWFRNPKANHLLDVSQTL